MSLPAGGVPEDPVHEGKNSILYFGEKNLKENYMLDYGKRRVVTIPFWSLDENGKKGKMTRHCTIDFKIVQMQNFVRWNLLGYKKGQRTKPEDIQAHEMHIEFTYEERQRIFESKHKLFVLKYPMVEMGLVRADNYAYIQDTWGLKTKGVPACFAHSTQIISSGNVSIPAGRTIRLYWILTHF